MIAADLNQIATEQELLFASEMAAERAFEALAEFYWTPTFCADPANEFVLELSQFIKRLISTHNRATGTRLVSTTEPCPISLQSLGEAPGEEVGCRKAA